MINNWLESPILPQYWVGELSIDIPKGYTLEATKDESITIEIKGSVANISGNGNCTLWYTMCEAQSKTASCYLFTLANTNITIYNKDDVYYCSLSNETEVEGTLYYQVDEGKKQIYTEPFVIDICGEAEIKGTVYTEYKYENFSVSDSKDYTIPVINLGELNIKPVNQTFNAPIEVSFEGKGDIQYKIDDRTFTYNEPFEINKDTEITYWNSKNGVQSNNKSKQYIYLPQPIISPDKASAGSIIQIDYQRDSTPPEGYRIYKSYTINGETREYTGPFSINEECVVKAIHTCLKENEKVGEEVSEKEYKFEKSSSRIIVSEDGIEFGDVNSIRGYLHTASISGGNQYRLYEKNGSIPEYSEYTEPINLRVGSAQNLILEVLAKDENIYRKLTFEIIKDKMPKISLDPAGYTLDSNVDPSLSNIKVTFGENIPGDITFTITYKWDFESETHTIKERIIPLQEGTLKVTLSSDYYEGTSEATGSYHFKLPAPTFNPGYQDVSTDPFLGLVLQNNNQLIAIFNNSDVGNIQYRYKFCDSVNLQTALNREDEYSMDWTEYNSEKKFSIEWENAVTYCILEARVVYVSDGNTKYSEISKIYYRYPETVGPSPDNNLPEPEVYPGSGTFEGPITITMVGKSTIMYQVDNVNRTYSMPIEQLNSITLTAWQEEGNRRSKNVIRNYVIL